VELVHLAALVGVDTRPASPEPGPGRDSNTRAEPEPEHSNC
jgi:hypothetical protein